ncbi:hypothetical protein RN001_007944 [Aquatica leii]|uniref:Hsp90 co-chaperone Cdc37 n=1 Tax=Aquatica leii TaxID=1421715 RepID=A0AAN7QIP9_9COLE|nr:hypothetical protein RN001_007944 [Aquatica leii]
MVDYSKWSNIEISDDEDETHPNIDTPSLFRWRHQARIDRMEEQKKAIEEHNTKKEEHKKKVNEITKKLVEAEKSNSDDVEEIRKSLKELKQEQDKLELDSEELQKKEKKTPWNVDTISKDGFAKTIINKKPPRPKEENLTDEEREARMKKFVRDNEKDLKHFGMLRRYEDSRQFLKSHGHLVCEDTANYLVIWCINLQMEEKTELMAHVAHQTICMQYILELAKQLEYDPRACLDVFFSKIQIAEPEYKATFDDELHQFKERIKKRATEKYEEAVKEAEEEERVQRLGPGGLDPVDVFESLPDELKQCFESQNIALLQETIGKMDENEARYHMKRCVDSGLWIPDAKSTKPDSPEDTPTENEEVTS